ncbi:hypothetical protein ASG48_04155 [Aurantimonas sp. Leaf443]|nr:hypothetical protein ASG48_04155 [Aurantimonas sp. Leaf443]
MMALGVMTQAASAEVRTLRFYNLHTKERASFAYKKNGRYDQGELKRINWFMRDWRKAKATSMSPQLMDLIWEAYRQSGSRDYINVICGYRSPATNAMLRSRSSGVARESQHTAGKALDFFIPDVPLSKMRAIGLKMQVGGVGFYPRSGSPFVHFDVGNARHWPRMNRRELMAVFPNGNTIHVPSDGKPLPGYQQALASYKQRRGAASLEVANASASGGGGGRSFLAMLFGGGADEADDEAEAVATPAPAAPKVRERAVETPATAVAAAKPVPPAKLPNGAAVGVPDTFDTGAPAPRAVEPEAKPDTQAETEVAMLTRVPVPTFAPVRALEAAPAPVQMASAASVPVPAVPVPTDPIVEKRVDSVASLVAALDKQAKETVASGQMAYAVPMPRERPPFASVMKEAALEPQASAESLKATVAAITPSERPVAASAKPALAVPAARVAAAAVPTPALLKTASNEVRKPARAAAPAAKAAPNGSGKSGRVGPADSLAEVQPKANVIDPQDAIAQRIALAAIVTDPQARAVETMKRPSADRLVGEKPGTVFVGGFSSEPASGKSDRFAGKAVNFLPVARLD